MQYERTIKTLTRAGFQVTRQITQSRMHPGTEYEAGFVARRSGSRRRIEATRQEDWIPTMRVVRDNDHDDIQSDYCAGTFVDTVRYAIQLATE